MTVKLWGNYTKLCDNHNVQKYKLCKKKSFRRIRFFLDIILGTVIILHQYNIEFEKKLKYDWHRKKLHTEK